MPRSPKPCAQYADSSQVVRRRGENIAAARDRTIGNKRKQRDDESSAPGAGQATADKVSGRSDKKSKRDHKDKGSKERKPRKEKAEDVQPAVVEKKGIEKEGQNIGSLIGRKRRRKAGK